MFDEGPGQGRMKIAFVELPDEHLDLMSHFTQHPDIEVGLVVSQDAQCYALRMAEILQIPLLDVPNRMAFHTCTHVIVGPHPEDLLREVRELLEGSPIQVLSVDQVVKRLGIANGPAAVDVPGSGQGDPILGDLRTDFASAAAPPDPLPAPSGPGGDGGLHAVPLAFPREAEAPSPGRREPGSAAGEAPAGPFPTGREHLVVFQPGESLPPGRGRTESAPASGAATASSITSRILLTSRFDVGSLLGDDLREALGALALDSTSGDVLQRIVDIAIRAAHAESGSLLLVDEGGTHLRIAAARGLAPDVVHETRIRIGQGVAGEVFATGEARLIRGRFADRPETGGDLHPDSYEAAVVPVVHEGRAVGVLCVNQAAASSAFSDRTIVLLSRFAHEASLAILKAIDLAGLSDEQRVPALERQIERIMSLKESLTQRLLTVADIVRRAYRADLAHVFLVDPVGRRLELVTGPLGLTHGQPRFIPLGQGICSWVVERGSLRVVGLWDEASGTGRAVVYLPVGEDGRIGLIVIESIPMTSPDTGSLLAQIARVGELISELISLERGLECGELLSELRMRVADESARLANLLPHERARAVLQFSIDLLAAETAVWIPSRESRPIWARPGGSPSVRLQAQFRSTLEAIAEAARERGRVAGIPSTAGDDDAPPAAAPYVAISTGQAGGVMLLVFSPEDSGGTPAQIPPSTLLDTLDGIAGLLPGSLSLGGVDAAAA